MSSSRKFKRSKVPQKRAESTAETTFRLQGEAECRRIADVIAKMLPDSRGFVLVTADYGGAGEPFSNTHYVARMRREDSARLLTELVDNWRAAGLAVEPTVQTATFIREQIYSEMRAVDAEAIAAKLPGSAERVAAAVSAGDGKRAAVEACALSVAALAIFDRFRQEALEAEE